MAALELGLQAIAEATGTDEQSAIIAAKARGLLIGYDARWKDAGWETLSTEEVFHLPIVNPETGAKSRTFTQAGKFDGIVRRAGSTMLLEHKTTADDITDPGAPYWRRLTIDSQVSAYVLAKWQQGEKLDGTLYDVIRKPGIRPKAISNVDLQRVLLMRTYCGFAVPEEIQNRLALTTKGDARECPELYAMRLARDCIDNPDKYFQRRPIPRLDSDITEYAGELWEVGQAILSARNRNAHYRNSGACMEYNTPCRFLGICSGYDNPDSDKWRKVENVHDELPIDGGRDVLSNSRLKTFQSCRRKHFYHYELGIRRVDDEDREALVLGSLLHKGLEFWWNFYRKDDHDSCSKAVAGGTESPTNSAAAEEELAF